MCNEVSIKKLHTSPYYFHIQSIDLQVGAGKFSFKFRQM